MYRPCPLLENLQDGKIRVYYRGSEPIKSFAIYLLGKGELEIRENATLIKLIVADKTIDVDTFEFGLKQGEKLFISTVDRNNNVSKWVRLN